MLLGLMTGLHQRISVQDFGLDNVTEADGLAVGRASGFVGKTLEKVISGVYTVHDATLLDLLALTLDAVQRFLEPSALAGMPGPWRLCATPAGRHYLDKHDLPRRLPPAACRLPSATHIVWTTGGGIITGGVLRRTEQAETESGPSAAPRSPAPRWI